MLGQTLALIEKELLVLLRAPRGLLALIVPPLLQLMIFGYAATFDISRAPIAIMNEDQGLQGRELAARFSGSPLFVVVSRPTREAEMRRLIDRGDVMLAVRIGQRFSAELARGSPADLQVLIDGRPLSTALSVQSYAAAVIARFNLDYLATSGLPRPTALTVTRAWFNPNLLSHWYVIPGLVAKLLLMVTLAGSALAVARERDLGTFERLVAAPLTPLQILAGKVVVAFVVGFAQGLAMSALAALWFGVPFRGAVALLAVALATLMLSAIGLGLLISSLARTQPRAIFGTFAFMVPAIMMSGFAIPISSMPEWMQLLTLANPIRYFIVIMRDVFLRGSGWEVVWPELWPMAVIAFATLAVSYCMLRRRLD
jgi:ABC-2 type transport system permease protein